MIERFNRKIKVSWKSIVMNKKSPIISIITVCYNEENNIRNTIESVLCQECEDFEYIIKDGNSIDLTNNIINAYKERFSNRGIVFKHIVENDDGIYFAMNQASEFCEGEYLLFLNAGDILFDSTTLKNVIHKMEDRKIDVFYGDSLMKSEEGECLFRADMSLINRRMPFCHQACLIRSSLFDKYKYDVRYQICADYDLILNLYEKKVVFQNLKQIICIYDMNGVSSTQFIKKRKEHENILLEHELSNCIFRLFHMLEAYVKVIAYKIVPKKMLSCMKRIYMKKIKHYEYWEGEKY